MGEVLRDGDEGIPREQHAHALQKKDDVDDIVSTAVRDERWR